MHKKKEFAEKLYQNYQGLLRKAAAQNYLYSLKEEAYAQASLIFCEAIDSFDEKRGIPFAGYAKAKVYHDLHSFFKKHRRGWQREVSFDSDDEKNEAYLIEESFEENIIMRHILFSALKKLPARQRLIIEYTIIRQYTQPETAAILGITQQAVAAQKKQALKLLREYLSKELMD